MSEELRLKVLAYLRLQEGAGRSEHVPDEELVIKTGGAADAIGRELDILEASRLIRCVMTGRGPRGVVLTSLGRAHLDEAVQTMSPEERSRIAFTPPRTPPGFEDR